MSQDTVISIPIDSATRDEISRMAESEHRKMAQMGRLLLKEALANRISNGFPSPEGQSSSSAASPGSTGDVEGATNNAKQVA